MIAWGLLQMGRRAAPPACVPDNSVAPPSLASAPFSAPPLPGLVRPRVYAISPSSTRGGDGDGSQCPVQHSGAGRRPPSSEAKGGGSGGSGGERGGACPVKHGDGTGGGGGGSSGKVSSSGSSSSSSSGGGCPVKHGGASAFPSAASSASSNAPGGSYDVGAERINPTNQMPGNQQDAPFPGQQGELSTDREASTIAKGGDSADGVTWEYPSSQQFYNALMRKGKGENVKEEDVDAVVAIHNNMNERAWNRLLIWENEHCAECPSGPRLARFLGRPDDLTPKAWAKNWLGYGKPFDRHDWFIDRCGKEVSVGVGWGRGWGVGGRG